MTRADGRRRIAIIGGGMAGLTVAVMLTSGDWKRRYDGVTVYQRGWRLGGKGASSRGPHARIEEHGLHILLGYYHSTFRMMREVYDELDRPTTDPGCPIARWEDAVFPSGRIGLTDRFGDEWHPWSTEFSTSERMPGHRADDRPITPLGLAIRSTRLLLDFHRSALASPRGSVTISASPLPEDGSPLRGEVVAALRGLGVTTLAGLVEVLERLAGTLAGPTARGALATAVAPLVERAQALLAGTLDGRHATRTRELIDLALTNIRGVVADRLLTAPDGFGAIDHLDYREWLRRHGAAETTTNSAIVRGMYDLVFAYEGGDPGRPRFSAGLGLQLAGRMLFDHDGGVFWKMTAGMGEIIFAPLYQVLAKRGVDFAFFHRLDDVVLDPGSNRVTELRFRRQVDAAVGDYHPLIAVDGLPCWPAAPLAGTSPAQGPSDLEHISSELDHGTIDLHAGRDFDVAVLAVSVGMLPHVAGELLDRFPRWRAMTDNVATVPTQSLQVWLSEDERSLGWTGPPDIVLSAFAEPFDTWASMSHLIRREGWPGDIRPRSLAYFCNVLRSDADPRKESDRSDREVKHNALDFISGDLRTLWPGAYDGMGEFRWDLLCDAEEREGRQRFDSQYWRANTDPSDRYVQSLPDTDHHRMRPDDTGVDNLLVAGDWTDCGLNAGCIEAAVRSGMLAAEAIDAGRGGADRPSPDATRIGSTRG